MKAKFYIALLIMLISISLFAGDFKIGTGTSTEYYVPMYGNANYNWSKILYTNAELIAAGVTTATTITKIAFYVTNITAYETLNQTIYMGYNYNTSYSTGLTGYPTSYTGYTQVYNGTINWTGPGWFEITLSTPYTYDPNSVATPSLEILWENRDGTLLVPYPKFNYTSTSYTCVYKSGSTYPTTSSGTRYSNRPNIWLMSEPTDVPPIALPLIPLNTATSIEVNTDLRWQHNGGQPDYYKLFVGSDYPPSNVISGEDIYTNTFDIAGYLNYGTIYYWRVVPHNSFGYAFDCPIWSFTTKDDPTIYAFPWTETFDGTFPNTNWNKYSGFLADPVVLSPAGDQWRQDDWLNITGTDKAAVHEVYSTMNGWLVTPPLNITSSFYKLQFDVAFLKWEQPPTGTPPALGGIDDRFVVLVGDGFSWSSSNIVREWNNSGSPDVLNNIAINGETLTIPLSEFSGRKRIAFYVGSTVFQSGVDNDLMINNVTVKETLDTPILDLIVDAIAGEVKINWSSVAGAVSYIIYAADTPTSQFNQIGTTNETQFVISNVGVKQFYKVVATTVSE